MDKSSLVSLTPIQESHLPATLDWINDPRIAQSFLFDRVITVDQHQRWFHSLKDDESQSIFAILDARQNHVGNLGFKCLDEDVLEMWIYIGPEHQDKGLGRAAALIGVEMAFHGFNRDRIKLHLLRDNVAARAIYTNAGFIACDSNEVSNYFPDLEPSLECMIADRRSIEDHYPRVAMMQPMMIPWLGFFELMNAADIFIFLDDFQFSRQGWGHRNRLFTSPGKIGYVTLPIVNSKKIGAKFSELKIRHDPKWQKKLRSTITQTYGRSEHFSETMYYFEGMFEDIEKGDKSLGDIEISVIMDIAKTLGIQTQIGFSSHFSTSHLRRSERILALLRANAAKVYYAVAGSLDYMLEDGLFPAEDVSVYFQNFIPQPYPQIGSREFHPRLSVIDALMNMGPGKTKEYMNGTRRWLPWDEATGK